MRKVLLSAAATVLLVVAACGGGGSKTAADSGGVTPVGGGGGGGGDTSDFCNTFKLDLATFEKIGSNNVNNQQVLDILQDLAGKAPSEIKADMLTVIDGFKKTTELASQFSADPSKASSFGSEFEATGKAFETATKNVETFAKDKCGIDLSGGNSTDSST